MATLLRSGYLCPLTHAPWDYLFIIFVLHEEFRWFEEGASLTCRIVDLKLSIVLYLAKILSVSRNLDWGFDIA
jgi:uncharacterized membrane protein